MLLTNIGFTVTLHTAERLVPSPVVAVMFAIPTEIAFTTPFSTVATLGASLFHVTVLLVVLSGWTVAESVNCSPIVISAVVLSRVIDVA